MTLGEPTDLFGFVQFEFPGSLGLTDGRYLVRAAADGDPERVMVVRTMGAKRRHLLRGRRPRVADGGAKPEPLALTRVTVVSAHPLPEAEARSWLERTTGGADRRERAVDEALALVNRALHAHRAATADPLVHEVGEPGAAAIRIGYGPGEGVADGRWTEARELARRPPRKRRSEHLMPQERLAAVLGGHDEVGPAESLLLRARLDLDQGRVRDAALQLRVGLEALLAELDGRAGPGQIEDIADLETSRHSVGDAANAALRGELGERLESAVRETVEVCERVLRRRRVLSG